MTAAITIAMVTIAVLAGWLIHEFLKNARLLAELAEAEDELNAYEVCVPAPAPPRTVPSSRATSLKDETFVRIWLAVPEKDELHAAVQQLVARELIEAIDYAARPDLAERPGALAQAQGSVLALMTIAGNLDLARTEPERWTAAGVTGKAPRRRGAETP